MKCKSLIVPYVNYLNDKKFEQKCHMKEKGERNQLIKRVSSRFYKRTDILLPCGKIENTRFGLNILYCITTIILGSYFYSNPNYLQNYGNTYFKHDKMSYI